MKYFNRLFQATYLAIALTCLVGGSALTGCKTADLEPGGAYSPAGQQPDVVFFQVEAGFDLAYSTVDAAFKFERDNRKLLWEISPEIKHALDRIRPQAALVVKEYALARRAYIANPVPDQLSTLETVLMKARQLQAAAAAALAPFAEPQPLN